jgi:regulatory protein
VDDKDLTRARNAAYRLLTYRPRSRAELIRKLQDREIDDAVIDAVLVDLERLGYVNDRQFAGQWAASRARLSGFGRRRIELELRNKGVDRELVSETLAEVLGPDAELETAKAVAAKKLNALANVDRETRRRRLSGFLERKGFSYEIIRAVLGDAGRIY